MSKYTIWQNYDVNVDDFREWLEEEFQDVDDEWEKQRLVDELNWLYLDDERSNLNVSCESEILVFGTLGLWDESTGFIQRNLQQISAICFISNPTATMQNSSLMKMMTSVVDSRTMTAQIFLSTAAGSQSCRRKSEKSFEMLFLPENAIKR